MSRVYKCLVLLLLMCSFSAIAVETERDQKIYIESDELEVDDLHGVSEYRGSVIFRRASVRLQADTVKLFEQGRQLINIIAHGKPVKLNQTLDNDRGETRAIAEVMEYIIKDERLLLKGQARLWQGNNEFTGDTIIYHIKDETVVAKSDKEQDGRVRIVIQPENISSDNKPAEAESAPAPVANGQP